MYIMRGDREGTSEKEAMGKKQHTGRERGGVMRGDRGGTREMAGHEEQHTGKEGERWEGAAEEQDISEGMGRVERKIRG